MLFSFLLSTKLREGGSGGGEYVKEADRRRETEVESVQLREGSHLQHLVRAAHQRGADLIGPVVLNLQPWV